MEKKIGIYIHIPFCSRKCFYCDFVSYSHKENLIESYIDAVCEEILQKAEILSEYQIRTIYFGGGTPSYINPHFIQKILHTLQLFHKSEDEFEEVTLEINPNSVTKENLYVYHACGINRLSIGLQSTLNPVLKAIGRTHTYEEFIQTLYHAKNVGFTNLSIDLMYPLPYLTVKNLKDSLEEIAVLMKTYPIKHVSVYNLEIHENTKLDFLLKNEFLSLVDEEEEYQMKNLIEESLAKNHFRSYEISNYAIPGYESKHNLNYWKQGSYLGFGVSASSFFLGSRYKNIENVESYIKSIHSFSSVVEEKEEMSKLECMKENIILNLRLEQGVAKQVFYQTFHQELEEVFGIEIQELVQKGLLQNKTTHLCLTKRGKEVANQVWQKFI